MTKLRNLIAAALLTLSVASLNAGAAMPAPSQDSLNPAPSVTGTCFIYMGGRWWLVPC